MFCGAFFKFYSFFFFDHFFFIFATQHQAVSPSVQVSVSEFARAETLLNAFNLLWKKKCRLSAAMSIHYWSPLFFVFNNVRYFASRRNASRQHWKELNGILSHFVEEGKKEKEIERERKSVEDRECERVWKTRGWRKNNHIEIEGKRTEKKTMYVATLQISVKRWGKQLDFEIIDLNQK